MTITDTRERLRQPLFIRLTRAILTLRADRQAATREQPARDGLSLLQAAERR